MTKQQQVDLYGFVAKQAREGSKEARHFLTKLGLEWIESISDRKMLPIDTVSVWCPSWDEIKGKARFYKTARIRQTGEYVRIIDVGHLPDSSTGSFKVSIGSQTQHLPTDQLCDFCL